MFAFTRPPGTPGICAGPAGSQPASAARRPILHLALFALSIPVVSAEAQDLSIDERAAQILPGAVEPLTREEAILTGREDIVLLEERKFFTAFANTGFTYTSNPSLSSRDNGDDGFFAANVGLRAETEIAEKYRVFAELSGFGVQYLDRTDLNYSGFGGAIGADTQAGPYTFGGFYAPQVVYDEDFGDHLVTLHRLSIFANRRIPLASNAVVAPTLLLSGIPSDPSDYMRYSAELSVPVLYRPAPGWLLTARPQVHVRTYPDFFEDVTGEDRTDYGGGVAFGASWTPKPWLSVAATVSFEANESTVSSLDYKVFSATPQIRLRVSF